jgi:hypothetical protein
LYVYSIWVYIGIGIDRDNGIMSYRHNIIIDYKVIRMARPIELGLVLKGKDAEDFWENERNPKVTKKQIKMFKEAMHIYKTNFKR